jgi:hypothetical protein
LYALDPLGQRNTLRLDQREVPVRRFDSIEGGDQGTAGASAAAGGLEPPERTVGVLDSPAQEPVGAMGGILDRVCATLYPR